MKVSFNISFLLALSFPLSAQYAPPAGQAGSTAIPADSSIFVSWATSCTVERGYLDISNPIAGLVDAGEAEMGIGEADLSIVSLGDSGVATLTFAKPIINGPGFDFAIFENSFDDSFLELAFVEVSSDGEVFFRFPSVSLTPFKEQVNSFGLLDATKLYNLAGKYRGLFGTPFDLEELADQSGLDVNAVNHIRIVDVVGSIIFPLATYDSNGNPVNDPFPTPFESGGFDLDGVGVINQQSSLSVREDPSDILDIYPNPISSGESLRVSEPIKGWTLMDFFGNILMAKEENFTQDIRLPELHSGIYLLQIRHFQDVSSHVLSII